VHGDGAREVHEDHVGGYSQEGLHEDHLGGDL